MTKLQSGVTKMAVTSRIWVQIWLSTSTMFTAASYQSHRPWEPVAGCLAWSSRRVPASIPGGPSRSDRRRAWLPARDRRTAPRRPRIPDRRRGQPAAPRAGRAARPSRPSARRAAATPWRRSRSSVTTSSAAVPSAPSSSRTSSMRPRMTASPVRAAAVAHGQPGRDPLVAEAALGRAVEDELDGGRGRDHAAQPTDERRRRRRARRPRQGVEQVRPVDEQAPGRGERVAVGLGHRRHRTRHSAPRLRSGRWASSCWSISMASSTAARPRAGRRGGPCRSRGPWRRRRVRHQQLDALPGRLPDPPRGDGRTRSRRTRSCRSARATAAYLREHDPGIRRVLVLGGERPRARAPRRGLRRGHRGRGRDPDEPGADRRLRRGRQPRRGRRRPRPEPDLRPSRRGVRLHPRRGAFHRHEPRPGLPDRARPPARCRLAGHRARVRDRRRRRSRSASPRRTCSRRPPTRSVASRPRRS